jgi:hypothetical protein
LISVENGVCKSKTAPNFSGKILWRPLRQHTYMYILETWWNTSHEIPEQKYHDSDFKELGFNYYCSGIRENGS